MKETRPGTVGAAGGGPAHVVGLADGWTLWRAVSLRGTGFPVDMLDRLAAPGAAAAVDRLIEGEAAASRARDRAADLCREAMKGLDPERRKPWRRVLTRLKKDRVPEPSPETPALAPLLDDLARARREVEAARGEVASAAAAALPRIGEAVRAVGRDPLFREALAWQNRGALHDGVDPLLRAPPEARDKDIRKHEQLIVGYLQRYCAKNDSIGFFGPFGWARVVDEGPALDVRPGPGLVAARDLHFEYWAIDELAGVLGADPRVRPWLAPRLHPGFRLEGDMLYGSLGRNRRLRPAPARLVAALDGETSAKDIAARLIADPSLGFGSEDRVFALLDQMVRMGAVLWALEVPIIPHPERALRRTLERIGDGRLRARLAAPLDEIEAAREAIAAAQGDPDRTEAAMADLEDRFTALTGKSATRHAGKVYAGRTLVYQDCRRDADVRLGPGFVARLAPPLALVLQSARWYSHVIAGRTLRRMEAAFTEMEASSKTGAVDFDRFFHWFVTANQAFKDGIWGVVDELHARWKPILAFAPGARRVDLSSAQIREQVTAAFAAPCPGWPGARFHAPDIMVAAESPEAARDGRYSFVIGELHAGANSIMQLCLLLSHPRPGDLITAQDHDLGVPQIFPVNHRSYLPGQRSAADSLAAGDLHLGCNDAPSWRPAEQVLALGQLVVERGDDGLFVRTRDGARGYPVMHVLEHYVRSWSAQKFDLVASAPHTPRVTIDDLVIARESWRLPCRDLAFCWEKQETDRFIGACRWARAVGLPRWVFVRVPGELKPIYVDLQSPPSVEIMAKLTRRGAAQGEDAVITVSEMLPTPDQAWLTDAAGKRYCSELRIVAVDPEPWRPSAARKGKAG